MEERGRESSSCWLSRAQQLRRLSLPSAPAPRPTAFRSATYIERLENGHCVEPCDRGEVGEGTKGRDTAGASEVSLGAPSPGLERDFATAKASPPCLFGGVDGRATVMCGEARRRCFALAAPLRRRSLWRVELRRGSNRSELARVSLTRDVGNADGLRSGIRCLPTCKHHKLALAYAPNPTKICAEPPFRLAETPGGVVGRDTDAAGTSFLDVLMSEAAMCHMAVLSSHCP